MNKSEPKPKVPNNWITRRQELSWEPEILISGIVLYALFQIPAQIDNAQVFLNSWSFLFLYGGVDETVAAILKTSVYFLISGLIINLTFRSIWVGMIGLSYVFPQGIDVKRLKLVEFFDRRINNIKPYQEAVKDLDRICSTIYSVTFLMFMATIGVTLFLLIITLIAVVPLKLNLISVATFELNVDLFFNTVILVFGGLYLLDFVTLGWLKRIKWFSVVYRPIYVCMSFATLAPLYRNIYYGLISNFNRWKISGWVVLYVVLFIVIANYQSGKNILFDGEYLYKNSFGVAAFDGYYRDKNPQKHSQWISIQSLKIGTEPLEILIPYKNAFEDSIISRYSLITGHSRQQIIEDDSLALESVRNYYRIKIDGKEIFPLPLYYIHWTSLEKKGMIGIVPIDSLTTGAHFLELWTNEHDPMLRAKVPFFKY
jgi:hypothetical protein